VHFQLVLQVALKGRDSGWAVKKEKRKERKEESEGKIKVIDFVFLLSKKALDYYHHGTIQRWAVNNSTKIVYV